MVQYHYLQGQKGGELMPKSFGHESQYFEGPAYRKEYLQQASSISFWLGLNQSLTIMEYPFVQGSPYAYRDEDLARCADDFRENGYFQTNPIIPATECELLASAVLTLIHGGIHPLFAMVYDQFWQVLQNLSFVANAVGSDQYW
jgi:hypothetical protein